MMNCSAFDWPTILRDNSSTRSPCGCAVGSDRFSGVSMGAFFGGRYHTAAAGYRVCAIGTQLSDGSRGVRLAGSAIELVEQTGGYGSSSLIGRTSMLPSRAGGILDATWMASLRSLASIR